MKKERVIFRREYDPYWKRWGYLAVFPDDEANPGRIGVIGFKLIDDGSVIFEAYQEASIEYVMNRKLVHKDTDEAKACLTALMWYYGREFQVCERR